MIFTISVRHLFTIFSQAFIRTARHSSTPNTYCKTGKTPGKPFFLQKPGPASSSFLLLQEKGKIVHCGKSVWMVQAELAFEASNGSAVELLRLEPADTWKREGATVTAHSYRGNHNSVIKSIEPGGIQLAQNKIKQFHGATLG